MPDKYRESLDMLKSEEGQLNAVFACFGSAAQHAQHLEAALKEFLRSYNALRDGDLTLEDLEQSEQKGGRFKTIGTLIGELKKYVRFSDERIGDWLESARQNRNFLTHDYFLEREKKLASEQGRMEMLAELVAIDRHLERAAVLMRAMRLALTRALQKSKVDREEDSPAILSFEIDLPGAPTSHP
jgi:hypothetical protein